MNNLPRQKLLEIVRRHGHEIINEPRRCEGLMRDNFPGYRREIAVLSAALQERIPAELLASVNSRVSREALIARLAARLHDNVAMEADAARWTVHTWALALGVLTTAELETLERDKTTVNELVEKKIEKATTQTAKVQPLVIQPASSVAQPQTVAQTSSAANSVYSSSSARMSFVVALDGSGNFLTMRDAIKSVPSGSLLIVRPGIYNEGLILDKPLEVVGDGALEEIIVRSHTSSCLMMRTDEATVRNLTLRGQSRRGGGTTAADAFFAVDIPHGRLRLEGCDISSETLACVAIHNPTAAPVLSNCRIHHSADSGIYAFDGAQGLIEACDVFENTNIAIAIAGGARTGVRNCHVHHGADAGIVVWDRATSTIEGCDIYSNRRTNVGISDDGIATLLRCRIHDGGNTGVFTHRSGQASVEECNIYRHVEPEIAVTGGGEVRLRGCQIHDGQSHGVFVQDDGRALLDACEVFRNSDSGLHVDAGGVGVARSSRLNNNGHVAVSCDAGGTVEVEDCDLTQNRVAAWLTNHGSSVKSRNNRT